MEYREVGGTGVRVTQFEPFTALCAPRLARFLRVLQCVGADEWWYAHGIDGVFTGLSGV
jgi:hypothetical protein